ncbi:MAG: MBL fold metallo-hydrolase [Oscillospiraceae bacterium]|nr:MBL fold metallo-hydrolase [Oscillospiraceae bacterium]
MKIETLVVGFINTNCYLVHDGKVAVVIDPGANAELIIGKAEELGVEIKHIFLTHAHFDHVLAVDDIIKKTGAKLVANVGERARMRDAELSGQTALRRRDFIPLYADIEIVGSGAIDAGEMHFEFITTPGHTEGSMCIICEDTMFSGDTLFAGTCGRCDLAGGDYEEMLRSLKKLYELPGDYRVLPGHEQATTLSHERVYNPYMAEAMRQ